MKSIEIKEEIFFDDLLVCKYHASIRFFHLNTGQIVGIQYRTFKKLHLRKVPFEQRLQFEVRWNHVNKHNFDVYIVSIFLIPVIISANYTIYLYEESLSESMILIREWYGHKR